MQQFPASFEYTAQFLVVFAQACYSGYFTSFRGDSEEERNSIMRRAAPLEDMSLSEMQYTTVFFYVYMLLRSEAFSSILVNSFYQPPAAANSSNLYLRIRTSIVDLSLWKEGLAGFNKQVFEVSLGPQCLNQAECVSISANINARYKYKHNCAVLERILTKITFLQIHWLPRSSQTALGCHSPKSFGCHFG